MGGLISMIGLVIVFGVIAVTLIALNAQQASVLGTGQRATELQHDRGAEKLSIDLQECTTNAPSGSDPIIIDLAINITNTGSETSRITTLLLSRANPTNITDSYDMWTDFSTYYVDNTITINPTKLNEDFVRPFVVSGSTMIFEIADVKATSYINDDSKDVATKLMLVTDLGNKYLLPISITTNTCS